MPHVFVEAFQAMLDAIRDQGSADDSRNSTGENNVSEAQQDDLDDDDAANALVNAMETNRQMLVKKTLKLHLQGIYQTTAASSNAECC
ncbi:hypothetical protein N7G274_004209 [Stereocaulon virgatum]|uniref:Uncharacterized protein n=1 Tax=Stereocaulon virgatum TaxID=373712 RepID=A0ABR4ACE2_9LECA